MKHKKNFSRRLITRQDSIKSNGIIRNNFITGNVFWDKKHFSHPLASLTSLYDLKLTPHAIERMAIRRILREWVFYTMHDGICVPCEERRTCHILTENHAHSNMPQDLQKILCYRDIHVIARGLYVITAFDSSKEKSSALIANFNSMRRQS